VNLLVSTLGGSWGVIPEVLGLLDPERVPIYAEHPAGPSLARLREQHDLQPPDEVWLCTTAGDTTREALAQLRVAESRRRLERNPSDTASRFELGQGLLELGEVDAAIAELQHAVKDPRKKTEALFLLGRAFQKKDLADLAIGQFSKALESAGTGALAKEALYEMGEICAQTGKRDEAMQHFTRILEQDIGFRDVAARVEQLRAS
jgi:tetratricopeptide (TPR) repeat protein